MVGLSTCRVEAMPMPPSDPDFTQELVRGGRAEWSDIGRRAAREFCDDHEVAEAYRAQLTIEGVNREKCDGAERCLCVV